MAVDPSGGSSAMDYPEHLRTYARDENELWFAQEIDRRFLLGARYRF